MKNRLMDYATGDYIRPATADEISQCRAEVAAGHEEGVILVDFRGERDDSTSSAVPCWVDGDLSPIE